MFVRFIVGCSLTGEQNSVMAGWHLVLRNDRWAEFSDGRVTLGLAEWPVSRIQRWQGDTWSCGMTGEQNSVMAGWHLVLRIGRWAEFSDGRITLGLADWPVSRISDGRVTLGLADDSCTVRFGTVSGIRKPNVLRFFPSHNNKTNHENKNKTLPSTES